jgi:hypothetical protein
MAELIQEILQSVAIGVKRSHVLNYSFEDFTAVVFQVEVFWRLTQDTTCSEVHAAAIFRLPQHYTASQTRTLRLETF